MREIATCQYILLVFCLSAIAFVDFFDISLIDVQIVEIPTGIESKDPDEPDFGAIYHEDQFCFDRMHFMGRTLFSQNVKVKAKQEELGKYVWDDFELDKKLGVNQMRPTQTFEDTTRYEGDWSVSEDMWNGRGVLVEPDGSIFEGYFDYGNRRGKGRSIFSNGDLYIGDYLNNLRSGYGKSYPLVNTLSSISHISRRLLLQRWVGVSRRLVVRINGRLRRAQQERPQLLPRPLEGQQKAR